MRILVVDDEREYGVLLFKLLARLGHDPVLASDSEEALSILHDSTSEVGGVITDIEMPGMNGLQLAQRIRDDIDGNMPIAFCTGSDPAHETTQRAATMGPVLPKASPLAHAREVIEQMVSVWSQPQP